METDSIGNDIDGNLLSLLRFLSPKERDIAKNEIRNNSRRWGEPNQRQALLIVMRNRVNKNHRFNHLRIFLSVN